MADHVCWGCACRHLPPLSSAQVQALQRGASARKVHCSFSCAAFEWLGLVFRLARRLLHLFVVFSFSCVVGAANEATRGSGSTNPGCSAQAGIIPPREFCAYTRILSFCPHSRPSAFLVPVAPKVPPVLPVLPFFTFGAMMFYRLLSPQQRLRPKVRPQQRRMLLQRLPR